MNNGVGRRMVVTAVATAVGLLAGGAVGFVTRGTDALILDRPPAAPAAPAVTPVAADTLLAWTPGGLPSGFSRDVRHLEGIDRVASVVSGFAWMSGSSTADGVSVDRPPKGLAIPIEVAGVSPAQYSAFLSPSERAVLPALAAGEGALGETSARLRRLGPGGALRFGGVTIRIAAVLPDAAIGAHELVVSKPAAAELEVTRERYLLIDPSEGASLEALTRRIREVLPPGAQAQVRGPGETPFFRQGDAVLPPVRLKELFGEFAARPTAGGYIHMDPRWTATHIVTATVPILGHVTCNRAIIPQLRGALDEIARRGYGSLIDPADYGGCYSPRFLNRNPSAGLSHHAWGVAVDVNVSSNPFGHTAHQDPRVVAAFARWGFTWGGNWLLPDGMHFEFVRFAPGD
ncbi:MAG TPA: M15 family metallopeptidase [Actinomycetota bacterium]|nr:M15 family metallopeptidase [Actinomycetota bacterium]